MPSPLHAALVELLRAQPALVAELLRAAAGIALPPGAIDAAEPGAESLTPPSSPEHRADLVIVLGRPARVVTVVEVQLQRDADKRRSWPTYVASLWYRHGCPAILLVVTVSDAVARWCARPIALGHPGFDLTPVVIGPSRLLALCEQAGAAIHPELALLAAMAASRTERALETATRAAEQALSLPVDRQYAYLDLLMAAMTAATRRKLEEHMQTKEYLSPTFRRIAAKGKAEGRAEGKAEALAAGILTVLQARGLQPSRSVTKAVRACHDCARLEVWLRRAVTVASPEELIDQ